MKKALHTKFWNVSDISCLVIKKHHIFKIKSSVPLKTETNQLHIEKVKKKHKVLSYYLQVKNKVVENYTLLITGANTVAYPLPAPTQFTHF